jgi:hypothetical protein
MVSAACGAGRIAVIAGHIRLHPPRHYALGDEHLDNFAELVAHLAADGETPLSG